MLIEKRKMVIPACFRRKVRARLSGFTSAATSTSLSAFTQLCIVFQPRRLPWTMYSRTLLSAHFQRSIALILWRNSLNADVNLLNSLLLLLLLLSFFALSLFPLLSAHHVSISFGPLLQFLMLALVTVLLLSWKLASKIHATAVPCAHSTLGVNVCVR